MNQQIPNNYPNQKMQEQTQYSQNMQPNNYLPQKHNHKYGHNINEYTKYQPINNIMVHQGSDMGVDTDMLLDFPPEDPVHVYDVNNMTNPLVYPTARPASYVFRPLMDNPYFFQPARGFPDKPAYVANLVETKYDKHDNHNHQDRFKHVNFGDTEPEEEEKQNDNPQLPSVLQLIGQQKYNGSCKYNYYVLLPSTGNSHPIKYTIKSRKDEELFDGDNVWVLGKQYTVRKNKSPFEYYAP